ncbi:hypothetical protein Ddc_17206 [Ditylenchus destructor]|nr:hypothetical protein Ddc_17206 [Ditylenchus destructor]
MVLISQSGFRLGRNMRRPPVFLNVICMDVEPMEFATIRVSASIVAVVIAVHGLVIVFGIRPIQANQCPGLSYQLTSTMPALTSNQRSIPQIKSSLPITQNTDCSAFLRLFYSLVL